MSNSIVFKTEFERQIRNKCSSYIDQNAKYNSIMQTTQSKPKNYKKIKSFISHKIRKLLHQNTENLETRKPKSSQVQLLKFDYKSNFVSLDLTEKCRENCVSRLRSPDQFITPIDKSRSRRYSNGTSSSSSTSSLSSCNSDKYFLISSEINHEQQSTLNFTENFVESSTPVTKNRIMNRNKFYDETDPIPFSSYEDDCSVDVTCQLEESTQCQESPVLIESTFNNSSLSNLSDDLIILQITNAPKQNKNKFQEIVDENLKIINKYHNDTNAVLKEPQWALDQNLNLALVNQLYFNPAGNGVFNPEKNY